MKPKFLELGRGPVHLLGNQKAEVRTDPFLCEMENGGVERVYLNLGKQTHYGLSFLEWNAWCEVCGFFVPRTKRADKYNEPCPHCGAKRRTPQGRPRTAPGKDPEVFLLYTDSLGPHIKKMKYTAAKAFVRDRAGVLAASVFLGDEIVPLRGPQDIFGWEPGNQEPEAKDYPGTTLETIAEATVRLGRRLTPDEITEMQLEQQREVESRKRDATLPRPRPPVEDVWG
jgi:hypothetical protein